ncbi:sugar kinase [[Actinomadura] parvosata subsp. kistnae]|uniref:Sugar kinase n=1 Tax=[Actinomadura] parvosata subsp. kistnae TaxID=1909395 RepID=A0A1U9ZT28_9ACTN|nr:ROK family transcriptional regulator [Nonomuraea sp. ATCC 55076]AQZ61104.1 sugar kinase [Nonomuraea sp. ATCC 55076]
MPTNGRHAVGAGALLAILRDGQPRTRGELARLTGLSRSTVSQRLDALIGSRWVVEDEGAISSGGRPASMFTFNGGARVVLAADLGATRARLAVLDLGLDVLAEQVTGLPVDLGPEPVLGAVATSLRHLLATAGRDPAQVCGVGIGLPGPVEHRTGRPVNPPIMPGWDGFPVPERLRELLGERPKERPGDQPRDRPGEWPGAPVLVDNDVNVMALGEHWAARPAVDHLIYIKIGTGIGCGIISGGRLHRGARGAAGDVGHIRVPASGAPCRCGNTGCLEAVAGGASMAAALREAGADARGSKDVVALMRAGDPLATRLVRQAGREVGTVMAAIVNFFNPSVIVLGGDVAEAGEQLLAGVRETIYSRSLPLATQHLGIRTGELGDRAGVVGAAVMVVEHVLDPATIDEATGERPACIAAR